MKLKEKCESMARNYQVVSRIVPNDKTQILVKFYEKHARSSEISLKIFHRKRIELSYASTSPLFETINELNKRLEKISGAPKPPPTKIRPERKQRIKRKRGEK